MITVTHFTFNPFSENTYVLSDESRECVIVDPGCYTPEEKKELTDYISKNKLKPVRLLNTHTHIDHVLGNKFIADTYKLGLEMCEADLPVLHSLKEVSRMYGIPVELSPEPVRLLTEQDVVRFGDSELKILFTPGHSPGSLVFYCEADQFGISGDVIFREGIGRYDFPGGDYETLLTSIRTKIFTLPGNTKLYSGHGPYTTVQHEKEHNPFMLEAKG